MASFNHKIPGRRRFLSTAQDEDARSSHRRWCSEPRSDSRAATLSRSRSRTMNSAMSFYAASNSDSSAPPSPRMSPHLTRDKPIPSLERKEVTARALLSRGSRILRKHGSKFSLSSLHTMDSDTTDRSVGRPVTAHAGSGPKGRHNPLGAVKREELKRAISEPFDFQHVTHTDRVFLTSMQCVPKTELVGEFSALRAGQASRPQLRGIRAEALPAQRLLESPPTSLATKPELGMGSCLPQTPPRPAPPPKDEETLLSPAHYEGTAPYASINSKSLTSSSTAQVPSPRYYSSRQALQPALNFPGAYVHRSFQPFDIPATDSSEDCCVDYIEMDIIHDKPLPGLPPTYAVSTHDDSAVHLHIAAVPRTLVDLADVPEEDEGKRQSTIAHRSRPQSTAAASSTDDELALCSNIARSGITENERRTTSLSRQTLVDDWDDVIDDSWDHAIEAEAADSRCPSSMTDRVSSFVDKAMTRLTRPEQNGSSIIPQANTALAKSLPSVHLSTQPNDPSHSTRMLSSPNGSSSSPLLGLGIELQQSSQGVSVPHQTTAPTVPSTAVEENDRGFSVTDSFNSDFSAVSDMSKSSSQESVIWSIASSIMGTQRSSNSSNSIMEQLPEYTHAAKSSDDMKDALESEYEPEEYVIPHDLAHHSYSPRKQVHQRAQSLATDFDFNFSTGSTDVLKRQPMGSNTSSPRASHQRVPSSSRIPIPARKSSINKQPENSQAPARRMRSATTTTRSRQASRASYSLFPGPSP